MADVELVIKIPEQQCNIIKSDLYNTFPAEMKNWGLEAIKNGAPLPKGHGRLVDISPYEQKEKNATPWELTRYVGRHIKFSETKSLSELPTIIPANNERETRNNTDKRSEGEG